MNHTKLLFFTYSWWNISISIFLWSIEPIPKLFKEKCLTLVENDLIRIRYLFTNNKGTNDLALEGNEKFLFGATESAWERHEIWIKISSMAILFESLLNLFIPSNMCGLVWGDCDWSSGKMHFLLHFLHPSHSASKRSCMYTLSHFFFFNLSHLTYYNYIKIILEWL